MTTLRSETLTFRWTPACTTIDAVAVTRDSLFLLAHDEPLITTQEEERISIASNWTLVWWRFRKNVLAVVSTVILLDLDPRSCWCRTFLPPWTRKTPMPGWLSYPFNAFTGWTREKSNPGCPVWQENATRSRSRCCGPPMIPRKPTSSSLEKDFHIPVLGLIKSNVHLVSSADPEKEGQVYLLGTDRLGRDQWSRLAFATQISMTIGMISVIVSVVLGLLLGGISGYFGGWIDNIIQRLIELLQSLPTIPIWLALTAALPRTWSPEKVFFAITIILALRGWTTLGREVRGRFLSLREEDFVLAAVLGGASQARIILKHMIPTFTSHIIATSTLAIPVMIVTETSLSFLGLGMRPPAISWGVMLQEAQNIQTLALAPWLLFPGLIVIVAVLAFNLVGDGLRDAADPYSH